VIEEVEMNNLPGALATRMLTWYREQAEMRLGRESKP
jgi:hypothetical protein